ncbi:MAG: molybdenum cofactor biosynthesis protein MoaE, partial [Paracoccaceae bacterium]
MKISVQAEPFDYGTLSNAFAQGHKYVGAVVTFCGIVRDDELGGLSTMEIEHY